MRPPGTRGETPARRHVARVRLAGGEGTPPPRIHPSTSPAAVRLSRSRVFQRPTPPLLRPRRRRGARTNVAAFSDTAVAIGAPGSWRTLAPSDPHPTVLPCRRPFYLWSRVLGDRAHGFGDQVRIRRVQCRCVISVSKLTNRLFRSSNLSICVISVHKLVPLCHFDL